MPFKEASDNSTEMTTIIMDGEVDYTFMNSGSY